MTEKITNITNFNNVFLNVFGTTNLKDGSSYFKKFSDLLINFHRKKDFKKELVKSFYYGTTSSISFYIDGRNFKFRSAFHVFKNKNHSFGSFIIAYEKINEKKTIPDDKIKSALIKKIENSSVFFNLKITKVTIFQNNINVFFDFEEIVKLPNINMNKTYFIGQFGIDFFYNKGIKINENDILKIYNIIGDQYLFFNNKEKIDLINIITLKNKKIRNNDIEIIELNYRK